MQIQNIKNTHDLEDDLDRLITREIKELDLDYHPNTYSFQSPTADSANSEECKYWSGPKSTDYFNQLIQNKEEVVFTNLFWLMKLRATIFPSYTMYVDGEEMVVQTDFNYLANNLYLKLSDIMLGPKDTQDHCLAERVKKRLLQVNEMNFLQDVENAGFDYALGLVDEYQDAYL